MDKTTLLLAKTWLDQQGVDVSKMFARQDGSRVVFDTQKFGSGVASVEFNDSGPSRASWLEAGEQEGTIRSMNAHCTSGNERKLREALLQIASQKKKLPRARSSR